MKAGPLEQKSEDKTWKSVCLMVFVTLLLSIISLSVVLPKVFKDIQRLQEEIGQLKDEVTLELGNAKHDQEFICAEMFRQLEKLAAHSGLSCLPCDPAWKAFQGSCYYFSRNNLTWFQANDSCAQQRAHLVIINSQAEQDFLTSTEHTAPWIGLYKDQGGVHRWADGSVPTYSNWEPRELHTGGIAPTHVMMLSDGRWKDFFSTSNSTFICEKRQSC